MRTRKRWVVLGVLFVVTTINYACRATISIAAPDIEHKLGLTNVEMGYIFSAFSWSYVLAQIPGGWLLDRCGSKFTYFIALFLWSLFTVLQGLVGFLAGTAAVLAFFGLRFALGVAEAPAFPANSRITSAWFPAKERGFASAIFNSAQYFGPAIFAPIIGLIVHYWGWQVAFVLVGGLGLLLAASWNKIVYGPSTHPRINQAEFDYIKAGGALVDIDEKKSAADTSAPKVRTLACIGELLSSRMLLGLYIFQYCINVLTYFFLTWFPTYLVVERHMTILKAGALSSLPAICGFIGGVLGGWMSDRMIRSGMPLSRARKIPIVVGMLLAMTIIACNYMQSDTLVIVFMSLSFFGKGVGALGWAVVADTSPKEAGGLSGALFNTFGNLAGIVTPIVIGYILEMSHNFNNALIFVGAHGVIAMVVMTAVVGSIHRLSLNTSLRKDASA
jgi:ACS family glucarate transporter-like MFS transporter